MYKKVVGFFYLLYDIYKLDIIRKYALLKNNNNTLVWNVQAKLQI